MSVKAKIVFSLEDKEKFAEVIRNDPYVLRQIQKGVRMARNYSKADYLESGKYPFLLLYF